MAQMSFCRLSVTSANLDIAQSRDLFIEDTGSDTWKEAADILTLFPVNSVATLHRSTDDKPIYKAQLCHKSGFDFFVNGYFVETPHHAF